jgi:F-type H+-transporting ATPase subunit b
MNVLTNHFFSFIFVTLADYPSFPTPEEFLEKIIPNLWAFLVQFLAFVVMVIVFMIFGYKPVKKLLEKRKQHIADEIAEAEKKNLEASASNLEAKNNIIESRKKADDIVSEAKKIAVIESKKIIDNASIEVKKMKDDATADIEAKKIDAKEDIRKEIINVALDASKEVLGREIDEKDNRRLVDDFVKGIDK